MENYYWNTAEREENTVFVLIIYDIVDNKTRNIFAKKMSGYGFRVQKSAFEAMISEKVYRKMLAEIPKLINKEEDSVRVYKILGNGQVSLFGVNHILKNEEVIII